jgi:hypothetical protein
MKYGILKSLGTYKQKLEVQKRFKEISKEGHKYLKHLREEM